MTTADALEEGRDSYDLRAWATARAHLEEADRQSRLEPEDLVRLATAAYLVGDYDAGAAVGERAHQKFQRRGDTAQAARCAFWLGFGYLLSGEMARAGGWFGRAQRLLDEAQLDCVERGYLLMPVGFGSVEGGDADTAYTTFAQAATLAERFGDRDLLAMARNGQCHALIMKGEIARGVALLDEVMVAVTSGELSPVPTGLIYCSLIDACHEIFDIRRAREWTAALNEWCAAQPELVPYRGQCLVHRSQVMQHLGAWPDAMAEAKLACERLSTPAAQPALGLAMYQLGELSRLRGDSDQAEEAFRTASQWGHNPQPGLAYLRLDQGRTAAAAASIRHAVDEAPDRLARAKVLAAFVEIMIAAGDLAAARAAADELGQLAGDVGAPLLQAVAAHARGEALLAQGEARAALDALREAVAAWRALEAPYDGARSRFLMGLARRELGDDDTAGLDLDAARAVFQQLGAQPDLDRLDSLAGARSGRPTASGGLSPRELEVLRLVAAGKTNHAIATQLVLSDKTVARHVSNIFTKLGLSSRSAATAYAYEHHLV